jgi:hypothetical protein
MKAINTKKQVWMGIVLLTQAACFNLANAAEVLPPDRTQPVTPPGSTRAAPPDKDTEMYDPRTGTFKRGSDRETDSTRTTPADPYDKSLQPTDIPPNPENRTR